MVIASMTVLDNLKMGAYLRKDAKQVQADIEKMYEYFPVLKERRHQSAGSLSGRRAADARGRAGADELSHAWYSWTSPAWDFRPSSSRPCATSW